MRITKQDRKRYTAGDCHILARALHRATGWPMAAFYEAGEPTYHAFVQVPNNGSDYYLDVNGVQSAEAIRSEWGWRDEIRVVTEECFSDLWGWDPTYGAYSLRRARQLAPCLAAQVETLGLNT